MFRNKCLIIAEAGVNHNGSVVIARKLINSAKEAGADYIKFQTFLTELNVSRKAEQAEYQKKSNKFKKETQFDLVKNLELSFEDFTDLYNYCKKKQIGFLSTGFDIPSIDFLDELGQSFFKIPSGEIVNKPYLKHIAHKRKPVILSTGMANLEEIEAALNILVESGTKKDNITLLHCNTEYPTPFEDVNLYAMQTIRDKFGVKVGYSDHTLGIEVPLAAVALGACVIEKHFTLDKNLPGPDHKASLDPAELKAMVKAIRNVEHALAGDGIKAPSKSELKNREIVRKSIHIVRKIKKGEVIKPEDLIMKRPGDGISPMQINLVIGRISLKDMEEDYKLSFEDLA